MGCPSEVVIGETFVFSVCTHDPDTGALTDADSVPSYRIYEDETATAILTGSMAKLDDANTTGFYTETITASGANGFEDGKTYSVYIAATVDSDTGAIAYSLTARTVSAAAIKVDTAAILDDTGTGGVILAADAIKAVSFDESTAWPLTAADTGATKVARVGADSDTLEILSDQLDANLAAISGIGVATGSSQKFEVTADNTGGAIKTVTFVGSQTNTFASTAAADGVRHVITGTATAIDIVYQVDVGARKATGATFRGYLSGSNDTITFQAYDFVLGTWDTRLSISGSALAANQTYNINLLSKHTGTAGADAGLVLLRFVCTGQSSPVLYVDEVLTEAVFASQTVGYQDGAVWIDTGAGTAGTVPGLNGTADYPVLTLADALTLLAALNLKALHLAPGSEITLTADSTNLKIEGAGIVHLGGQIIAKAEFNGLYLVDGTGTGDDARFTKCGIGALNVPHSYYDNCDFKNTMTLTAGDEYFVHGGNDFASTECEFTFAAGATLALRQWRGGLQVNSMAAGDTLILDGAGRLVIDGTCSGGAITIRGHFGDPTGASAFETAGGTITETERVAADTINAQADAALADYDGPTDTEMIARTLVAADYFDPVNDAVANVTLVATTTTNSDMVAEAPTAETNADAVWNELIADHTTSTTFGGKNQKVVPSETIGDYKATGFATSGALSTAQADLDTITGSDGATLATTQGNYAPAVAGDSMALTAAAIDAIFAEIVETEGSVTLAQILRTLLAVNAGEASGGDSSTIVFSTPDGAAVRATLTVDADGNRSGVTLSFA